MLAGMTMSAAQTDQHRGNVADSEPMWASEGNSHVFRHATEAPSITAPADPDSSVGGPEMAAVVPVICRDLDLEFDGFIPPVVIERYAVQAAFDLAESIAGDALAEMATRLATARLQERMSYKFGQLSSW